MLHEKMGVWPLLRSLPRKKPKEHHFVKTLKSDPLKANLISLAQDLSQFCDERQPDVALACFARFETWQGFQWQGASEFVCVAQVPSAIASLAGDTEGAPGEFEIRFLILNPSSLRKAESPLAFAALCNEFESLPVLVLCPFAAAESSLETQDRNAGPESYPPFWVCGVSAEVRVGAVEGKSPRVQLFSHQLAEPLCGDLQGLVAAWKLQFEGTGTFEAEAFGKPCDLDQPGQNPESGEPLLNENYPKFDAQDFEQGVARAQSLMRAGECYLLNLTRRVKLPFGQEDFTVQHFLSTWLAKPSRFGANVRLPKVAVMSFSPERFVSVRDGWIATEPIKGTAPLAKAHCPVQADAEALWAQEKEIFEQTLVVDLLRHDLGGVCEPGTVAVFRPFFARVAQGLLQMQSLVFGRLRTDVSLGELLAGILPAGSVSGTPKRRSCQIIEDLEHGPRGYYTGIIGVGSLEQGFESQVLIRSVFFEQAEGSYAGVGAGVTTLSVPASESRECLLKLRSFLGASLGNSREPSKGDSQP